jgi:alginate O-acetyltransferase complex protein AlgJ
VKQNYAARRSKRHFTYLYIVLFALVILGMGLSAILQMTFPIPPDPGSVINGAWSARLEEEFESAIPFSDRIVSTWSAAGYLLFNRGLDGLLIGREGWLFSEEEWFDSPDEGTSILHEIPRIHAILEEQDISLLIVPIPAKNLIYSDFHELAVSDRLQSRYSRFLDFLNSRGIDAVDIQSLYQTIRRSDSVDLYLKSDTHWSPEGASLAAEAIAERVASRGYLKSAPPARFESGLSGRMEYRGDLFEFLPGSDVRFGPFFRALPDTDDISTWENLTIQAPQFGLFDVPTVPVALIGTSYSAGQAWNFEGFLRQELASDIASFAMEGRGALQPMIEALKGDSLTEFAVSLVIWEIPIRFIPSGMLLDE